MVVVVGAQSESSTTEVVVVGAQSESSTTEVVGAYNRRKRNNLV